jgi:YHS domain-containing protein
VFCAVRGSAIPSAAKAAGKAAFNGKTYYFCCAGCEEAFTKEPARFAAEADKRGAAAAAATPAAP